MKPIILLLSTYPIVKPRHGGQIRLFNIAKAYLDGGWQVESISVYESGGYPTGHLGKRDIPFPINSSFRKYEDRDAPLISDLLAGRYAASENGGLALILNNLPLHIDAIHVEQPWLWELAHKIKQIQKFRNIILIYGSQNVEAPLKHEILDNADVPTSDNIALEIDALEKLASREADLVLATTQSDLNTFLSWGAKNVILAANGIEPWEADTSKICKWKSKLPNLPWLLYVASAHPPNFQDFPRCLGGSLGSIPPDSKLVIAGSVSSHLAQEFSKTRWHSLNLRQIQLLHTLEDEDLAAVKTLAHGFLLPIIHGGGSNLKTAEAIYSGANVIGSEMAFRGFEKFLDLPGITVARTPEQFHTSIRNVLASSSRPQREDKRNKKLIDTLRWDKCLESISSSVTKAIINKSILI